jgi:hypothetical protein
MTETPYDKVHPKEGLSLEVNFRSVMAGEGSELFGPVPVEDVVSFAAVGSPVTIPMSAPYLADELQEIAGAVRQGGGTLTLMGAARYPADLLESLEKEAPGQIRHA